jgi:hypothetical protein
MVLPIAFAKMLFSEYNKFIRISFLFDLFKEALSYPALKVGYRYN